MDQAFYEQVGRRQEWEKTMAGQGTASGVRADSSEGLKPNAPVPAALIRYLTRLGISQPGKGEEEAQRLGLLPEHHSRLLKVYRRLNRGR